MKILVKHTKGAQFVAENKRGHKIIVDLAKEHDGYEEGQVPTEVLASVLGACIGSTVRVFCLRHDIPFDGLTINVDYEKVENPSRLAKIDVELVFPAPFPEKYRKVLIRTAEQCTIHNTLTHPPEIVTRIKE
jgi:putative redox protein